MLAAQQLAPGATPADRDEPAAGAGRSLARSLSLSLSPLSFPGRPSFVGIMDRTNAQAVDAADAAAVAAERTESRADRASESAVRRCGSARLSVQGEPDHGAAPARCGRALASGPPATFMLTGLDPAGAAASGERALSRGGRSSIIAMPAGTS